ncbi:Clavaminate synthase-like protein [Rhizodiscina lignyota]|uniref:Clavaminate synthase-like protein n=1 Tax=Rhizodiscina lignyota TaxID=1504668 RepID=A0A9P4IE66_9PEZI|nr:Clavaminate synthase-like protein [Rhizodiscina lignyota]
MATLPIIDIAPYLAPSSTPESRHDTAQLLHRACTDTGFFYLTGHGITSATTDRILDLARRFFLESSDAEKALIQRKDAGLDDGDGGRGYQKIGENVTGGRRDFHEAVDLYAPVQEEHGPPYKLLMGKNLWPQRPQELKPAFENYIKELKQVGTAVVKAMGDALGLLATQSDEGADVFVEATGNSFWVMRMIGYPGLPGTNAQGDLNGDVEQFSCGAHTDYGCVTLLLADQTPNSLQVQAKSGDWMSANPIPGAFIVNIGDMMERWTNGIWKSTNHRVIHRGENYRVSVPFFFEPNFDAVVRPLQKCVRETGGEAKYTEVVYGDFLTRKIAGNFY